MSEPRVWLVTLPFTSLPISLNGREHFRVKARKVAEVREAAGWVLRSAKIPKMRRVAVQLRWIASIQRDRDTDNTVATLKPVVDAMVDVGIISNDTPDHIRRDESVIEVQRGVNLIQLRIEELL